MSLLQNTNLQQIPFKTFTQISPNPAWQFSQHLQKLSQRRESQRSRRVSAWTKVNTGDVQKTLVSWLDPSSKYFLLFLPNTSLPTTWQAEPMWQTVKTHFFEQKKLNLDFKGKTGPFESLYHTWHSCWKKQRLWEQLAEKRLQRIG